VRERIATSKLTIDYASNAGPVSEGAWAPLGAALHDFVAIVVYVLAVSYTHLDVYKRQPPREAAARPTPDESEAVSPVARLTLWTDHRGRKSNSVDCDCCPRAFSMGRTFPTALGPPLTTAICFNSYARGVWRGP